jgi:DNA recombination protein RmuC
MEWIIIALLAAILGLVGYLLLRKPAVAAQDTNSFILIQQQMQELSRAMEQKLGEGTSRMFEGMRAQSADSQRLMSHITEQVSKQLIEVVRGVSETKESTKQVFVIAEQLQNLERVLKNQKQRGNLGEASLELILSNVLPPGQYQKQYAFADGEIVDMVVKTRDGMVPIDSKFPLENYLRFLDETDDQRREQYRKEFKNDVKKKIDQTSKYIRPGEGTMPFAFMYIPAEGIYYDLLNDTSVGISANDLIEYAYKQKNVLIASPTTFLAYLQTVLFGNQRAKIQETATDIIRNVSELGKHLKAYEDHHNALGKSLNTAVGHFDKAGKAYRLIDKDVVRITEESIGLELEPVDKPRLALDE